MRHADATFLYRLAAKIKHKMKMERKLALRQGVNPLVHYLSLPNHHYQPPAGSRSLYMPHQNKRECARRVRQMQRSA